MASTKNILDISLGDLEKYYSYICSKPTSDRISKNINTSQYLYKYTQAMDCQIKKSALLVDLLPSISNGDAVQLINGNANIHSPSNSHLRCLLSYALQIRLTSRKVHLIISNLPSIANYKYWSTTSRYSYEKYVKQYINDNLGYDPYESITILLDSSFKDWPLRNCIDDLSFSLKSKLKSSSLILGMSGGGPNYLGSHGLEWAEGLIEGLDEPKRATLMCHMYDDIKFTSQNILLSMSANTTLKSLENIYSSRTNRVLQSKMINPHIFNRTCIKNAELSHVENKFLSKLDLICKNSPSLLIAGPWLEKKIRSGIRHADTNQTITLYETILPVLEHFKYNISVICIGASHGSLVKSFVGLPDDKLICLEGSDQFSLLIQKIAELRLNLVATFVPNAGNGSTNSEISYQPFPSIFLAPNDSEAMAPSSIFVHSTHDYIKTIIRLFESQEFQNEYLEQKSQSIVQHNEACLGHILNIFSTGAKNNF